MRKIKNILKLFFSFIIILSLCLLTLFSSSGTELFAGTQKIKVFLDPGHGGRDPGAIGYGYYEKTANLDIALRVKSKLEAGGLEVIMRRTDDRYHSLDEIVSLANNSGADIFLSIHNNASISPYAHGTETYWCANGVAGSNQLANLVQSHVLNQIGRANRGVKTANFRVIKYTTMPAALIECAFISNQTECGLLQSEDFRERCALGIASAIGKFSEGIIKPASSGSGTNDSGKSSGGRNYSDVSTPDSSGFSIGINYPPNSATVAGSFILRGWSADLRGSPAKELKKVKIYNSPERIAENLLGKVESFETNILGSQGVLQGGWQLNISCDDLNEGENILYINAFDKDNNYSTGNIKVNVLKSGTVPENLNLNPVAKPGGPYSGQIEQDIEFNGSYSFDPDGVIAEYIWDFGDGNTSNKEKPSHSYESEGKYTVSLTVKDNNGKSSSTVTTTASINDPAEEEEGEEEQETDETQVLENVSNSTSVVGYIDIPEDALLQIFVDRDSEELERATRIAPLYLKYGKLFNLRADIAWAQMCHETGFLEFSGDVSPGQNNFCGLGATGGGVPGHSFDTEELGVIAHYAHLAWYYFPDDVNEYCNSTYDPRHFGNTHSKYTGDTTLGFMNGRWAPGATYTDKIILFTNQVIQSIDSDIEIKSSVEANAGGDKQANIGQSIKFDASGSIIRVIGDVEVSYRWDWDGDGTFDKTADTAVVKHTYQSAGTFDVTLKISLSDGVHSKDKVKVVINNNPIADPGGPYKVVAGKTITFDGSGSSDTDGKISEYIWDFGDGEEGSGKKPEHIYEQSGEFRLKLKVKDDRGALSTEESTSVTVEKVKEEEEENEEENTAPIADPGGPYEAIAGEYITFDGSGSKDLDGKILEYLWDFGDGNTGSGINPSYMFQEPGNYTVELTVVDDLDLSSTTESTNVDVVAGEKDEESGDEESKENKEGTETTDESDETKTTETTEEKTTETTLIENEIPVAEPGGPYTTEAGKTITFDGSGSSDSDGEISEYIWDFGDGEEGSGITPGHLYEEAGEYTAGLIVKDNEGGISIEVTTTVTISEKQKPVNTSIITNSTSFVGYYAVTAGQLVSLFENRGSGKVGWAERLAPIYIQYGQLFNLRADIAWAQMCHETGFLEFSGDVLPGQNNFCGLGATGGGEPGDSFATEELGIIAHYAHLAWYYYPDHINEYCNSTYDPRHFGENHPNYTGDKTVGFLNGRWAPGPTYTDKILKFANQLYQN